MRGKKGDEKLLSIYWFVILIIITIGIVAGVLHVFGSNVDVRMAEAGLLRDKIVECLVDKGELVRNLPDSLKECKIDLNDNTEKYKDREQYAVKLELYDENLNFLEERKFGNTAFFAVACYDCYERANEFNEKAPRGEDVTLYVLDKGKGRFLVIKTAVDKYEKNI